MASRLLLSNDTVTAPQGQGIVYDDDHIYCYPFANATSAHGPAATSNAVVAGPMKQNGQIVDFAIGVTGIAISASGFVSANVSANVRINSVSCLSTIPALIGPVAGSATQFVKAQTNLCSAGNGVSAIVNTASAAFSTGDYITMDYQALSAGSAAAGTAGTGLWARVTVRYNAQ